MPNPIRLAAQSVQLYKTATQPDAYCSHREYCRSPMRLINLQLHASKFVISASFAADHTFAEVGMLQNWTSLDCFLLHPLLWRSTRCIVDNNMIYADTLSRSDGIATDPPTIWITLGMK